MASHSDRQYSPVSTRETSAGDALSVRVYPDMADAINNGHFHACCHKLRSSICFPNWTTWDAYTGEHVIAVFGPAYMPDGYSDILWTLGHKRTAGAGSAQWRLKSSSTRYTGPIEVFDSAKLSTDAWSNTITTTSDEHIVEHSFINIPTKNSGGDNVFFILTAQNSVSGTRAAITTIDIKPVFKT